MSDEADPGSLIQRVIGGCRLERYIAGGGMGHVYEAVEEGYTRRRVALKLVKQEYCTPRWRARFELEARLTATVEHPHVVRVYTAGVEDGHCYLTMEYAGRGSLAQAMGERELSQLEAVDVGLAVARALARTHAAGIVHLDVKPPNILLGEDHEGRGCWKLVDFGLARAAPREGLGDACGTPEFMPPEQWQGQPLDVRTDLYALGRTLYLLLAGRHPYDVVPGADYGAWYRALSRPPRSLRQAAPRVLPELCALVDRLVARQRSERPFPREVVDELLRCRRALGATDAAAESATLRSVEPPPAAAGPPPPLVAREAELRRVDAAIARVHVGEGAFLVFSGPAGVGRSRMVDESAQRGAAAGLRVLRGGPSHAPFGILRAVLRDLFELAPGRPPEELRDELVMRLLELRRGSGVVGVARFLEWHLLGMGPPKQLTAAHPAELAQLVAQAAGRGPPLLVLADGLEQAGSADLDFVRALGRLAGEAPLLVIGEACERTPCSHELELLARDTGEWRALPRLNPAEMRRVARAAVASAQAGAVPEVPERLLGAVVDRAGGLPRIAVAAVRRALALGVIQVGPEAAGGDPVELRAVIDEFLREYRTWAREASAPAGFGPEDPQTQGEIELPPTHPGLATATTQAPGKLQPRERGPAPADCLEEALRLRSAADLAGAIGQLERALADPAIATSRELLAQVALELARSRRLLGSQLEEGLEELERAAGRPPADPVLALGLRVERAWLLLELHRYADADAALADAGTLDAQLAALSGDDERREELLRARAGLAHVRTGVASRLVPRDADDADVVARFAEARALAGAAGALDLSAQVHQTLGDHKLRRGELDAAEALLQVSRDDKERLGDKPGLARVHGSLARLAKARGEPELAVKHYLEDLRLAEQLEDHRGVSVVSHALGELHEEAYQRGGRRDTSRIDQARAAFERGEEAALRSRNLVDVGIAAFYRGRFLSRTVGDAPEGIRELERALDLLARGAASDYHLETCRRQLGEARRRAAEA